MIEVEYKGYIIRIGNTQDENDMLVKTSDSDDYWAHANDHPSAHAIILNPTKQRIKSKIIKRACCLIKSNTNKLKSIQNVDFCYTRIKNITPTEIPGQVTLGGHSILTI